MVECFSGRGVVLSTRGVVSLVTLGSVGVNATQVSVKNRYIFHGVSSNTYIDFGFELSCIEIVRLFTLRWE